MLQDSPEEAFELIRIMASIADNADVIHDAFATENPDLLPKIMMRHIMILQDFAYLSELLPARYSNSRAQIRQILRESFLRREPVRDIAAKRRQLLRDHPPGTSPQGRELMKNLSKTQAARAEALDPEAARLTKPQRGFMDIIGDFASIYIRTPAGAKVVVQQEAPPDTVSYVVGIKRLEAYVEREHKNLPPSEKTQLLQLLLDIHDGNHGQHVERREIREMAARLEKAYTDDEDMQRAVHEEVAKRHLPPDKHAVMVAHLLDELRRKATRAEPQAQDEDPGEYPPGS
jgi:hypothetical protein